jgi:hypothetical protein
MLTGQEKIKLITILDEAGYDVVTISDNGNMGAMPYSGQDQVSLSIRKKVPDAVLGTTVSATTPPMP